MNQVSLKFTPSTYEDYIKSGEPAALELIEEDDIGLKVRCQCGAIKRDFVMVDLRHVDNDQDWACDGCWTDWERNKKPIHNAHVTKDGKGKPIVSRSDWSQEWFKTLGAPQAVIDVVKGQNRKDTNHKPKPDRK